jgi:hypothetical protein
MSERSDVEKGRFVKELTFGFADSGRTVELRFKRANGNVAYIPCAYENLAKIVFEIQEAAGQAWGHQRAALGGHDPRTAYPISAMLVDHFQGATATNGQFVISVVLKSGLRLELSADGDAIQDLIDWLEELKDLPSRRKPLKS